MAIPSLKSVTFPLPSLEMLEQRLLLAGGLCVTGLTALGGAGHPFDQLRIQFNQPVDAATFTAADVTMTGPSGALTPAVNATADPAVYNLVLAPGTTDLDSYTLVLGPNILDLATEHAMDQNHDSTPGQPADAYQSLLAGKSITVASGNTTYDGWNLVLYGNAASISGTHSLASLSLQGGAVLTHAASTTTTVGGMELHITDGLVIDATSRIDASAKGYVYDYTHGNVPVVTDSAFWGGSYGGLGYNAYTETWGPVTSPPQATYGDYTDPTEPGSGGDGYYSAPGGSGGGLIRIWAATADIEGSIVADGGVGNQEGAGSGGGIRLEVGTLSGGGFISTDGGDAEMDSDELAGAGGGGRIALYYQKLDTLNGFDLTHIRSIGGSISGQHAGAPGTVYIQQTGQSGQLRIDSMNQPTGMWTPLGVPGDASVTVSNLTIHGAGTLVKPDHQMPLVVDNLTLSGGGVLSHLTGTSTDLYSLDVTVHDTLTIDAQSKIDVTGAGSMPGMMPASTPEQIASAGSYGGMGYVNTGFNDPPPVDYTYGDFLDPTQPGSGEGHDSYGAFGGGLVRLSAGTAIVNGAIVADGGAQNGYVGSGGGIRLDVGTLEGSGSISAQGANFAGGGRIALYYDALNGFDLGNVSTDSSGQHPGSAGTIYLHPNGQEDSLVVRSSHVPTGLWTPLGSATDASVTVDNVVIDGAGAVARAGHQMPIQAKNVSLLHGGTLGVLSATTTASYWLDLQVSGVLTIDKDSKIDLTGGGYSAGRTAGNTDVGGAGGYSGGSYGGLGGADDTGGVHHWQTNASYGDFRDPLLPGSGGGGLDYYRGGSGGGLGRITVASAVIDGAILANGVSQGGGAGSGGGLRLDVGTLSGSGSIAADGGQNTMGGGGGGGRVALYYTTLGGFDLSHVTALAGDGPWNTPGAAGTVYLEQAGNPGTLVIDNHDGPSDHWTPLGAATDNSIAVPNLVISGGANVRPEHQMPINVDNLTLSDTAVLSHLAATGDTMYYLDLHVTDTLRIDSGASIDVTNLGYLPGHSEGNSAYRSSLHSGGSYGGHGYNPNTWDGVETEDGRTYGDYADPTEPGSGGAATQSQYSISGSGGGLVRIWAGTAIIDGAIIADGGTGSFVTTGSGGGIRLEVGTLSGSGTIAANGGDSSANATGGGGRVAVYYDTVTDFDLSKITAASGVDSSQWAHAAGGPGTVYLKQTGQSGLLSIDNAGRECDATTTLGQDFETEFTADNVVINGAGVLVEPDHAMTLRLGSLTLSNGASLTHLPATQNEEYSLKLVVAGQISIDEHSSISVSGKGYLPGQTIENRTVTSTGGGSYGGQGGGNSAPTYGNSDFPNELGSGGALASLTGTYGSAGGGLVSITAGAMGLDGGIYAYGADSYPYQSPGGAGGGVLINVGTLTGSGQIRASGGDGYGGGGGGRVAIYTWDQQIPTNLIVVSGGRNIDNSYGNTHQAGAAGTKVLDSGVARFFYARGLEFHHDTEQVRWEVLGINPSTAKIDLTVTDGSGQTTSLGTGVDATDAIPWDTTTGPDGDYTLQATFHDADGNYLGQSSQTVKVYNAVYWHSGRVLGQVTWGTDRVHVVRHNVEITAGSTLTVAPGAIVKFYPGARIIIDSGATLDAPATDAQHIIFTSLADDTAGGDTNQDGSATQPVTGDWAGFLPVEGSTVTFTTHVETRYLVTSHSGQLANSEVWTANNTHYVTADLIVPGGMSLVIEPGAIVKFASGVGIFVASGGNLTAEGSNSLPILFTSDKDDSVGGDTNGDGSATTAASGDWSYIEIDGTGSFDHVQVHYAGRSGGNWNHVGSLRLRNNGNVTMTNSLIADSFFDGIMVDTGTINVSNTVLVGNDRGVYCGAGNAIVTNCTLDANRTGVWGSVTVVNSVITNSANFGVGNATVIVRYSDVWSPPGSGSTNYWGADQTGQNGNISANPKYADADNRDYTLGYLSPVIDAADGAAAPATDTRGVPRFDDPRTSNTGTPTGNDFADLGAFEFSDTASAVDLVASNVAGPSAATVGQEVTISWTLTNRGTVDAVGPWHDAVYLALNGAADPYNVWLAGEPVDAEGEVLKPGQSMNLTARVIVPAGYVGQNVWEVVANDRGDLFEGTNRSNNAADAAAPMTLSYNQLTLGGSPAAGTFTGNGQGQWFILQPDQAGENIKLLLDLAGNGATELYYSMGRPPTRSSFDRASTAAGQPDQKVQISSAHSDQPYYVLVYGVSVAANQAFSLAAAQANFAVDSVSPATGGNVGNVTVGIYGESIPANVVAQLTGPDGVKYYGHNLYYVDTTEAYATFELTGATVGSYDLQLISPDGAVVTKPGAFHVTQSTGSSLKAEVVLPGAIRAGRPYTFQIEYANVGDTDMYSPILHLATSDQRQLGLTSDAADGLGQLSFLGYSTTGPAGILRPGEVERITIYSMAGKGDLGTIEYTLDSQAVQSQYPRFDLIDWSGLARQYSMPGGSSNPLWQTFMSQMGNTWDEFTAHLDQMLTDQVQAGLPADAVLEHQIQRAFAAACGSGSTDNDTLWITDTQPTYGPVGGFGGMDVIFNRAVDPATFTADDVTVNGPDQNEVWTVTQVTDRVCHIGFQTADGKDVDMKLKGTYTVTIGPDISDANGRLMDQDRDGVTGEAVDDALATSVDVVTGRAMTVVLHVAGQSPSGPVDVETGTGLDSTPGLIPPLPGPYSNTGIDHVTIEFSRAVQFLTFTPADLTLTGPAGAVPVTGLRQIGEATWEIDFPRQTALGQYTLTVGKNIQDLEGYNLDQDLDGLDKGGASEIYAGTFDLVDIHGLRIIGAGNDDYLLAAADHLDFTFSKPINPATLAGHVTLTGPDSGAIAVTGISAIDGTTYRISFATITQQGWYTLTVGPGVTDLAGNAMDQNQDGRNGRGDDAYAEAVLLAVDPTTTVLTDAQQQAMRALQSGGGGVSYGPADPVDHVILKGTVNYGSLLGSFYPVPSAAVELWEVQGALDAYPGNPNGGDTPDTRITTINTLTHSAYLSDKGEYLFDESLFGSPLLLAEGTPRQFYVVVAAENDSVKVYDAAKQVAANPGRAGYQQFPISDTTSIWVPRAVVCSAVWTATDKSGQNTQVHTSNVSVQSDVFTPLEWIKWGAAQFQRDFGTSPRGKVNVLAPMGASNAFYSPTGDFIMLGAKEVKRPATVLHEYGHSILASYGGGVTLQGDYGVVQESRLVQPAPGKPGQFMEVNPIVPRPETAYDEGWASFVAAYLLRNSSLWSYPSLYDRVDQVRSLPYNLNHNNWWMGFDAYGLLDNVDAMDNVVTATSLASAFLSPMNGANLDANTGDQVLGGVETTLWEVANSGPAAPAQLWAAVKASAGVESTILSLWNALPHSHAYINAFLDNGIRVTEGGDPIDDAYEGNNTRAEAATLSAMTDFSGNLLGPISVDNLIMAEPTVDGADWYSFSVPGDQFATPDQKRDVSIQMDWNPGYGDLDIYAQNVTTGDEQAAVLEREPGGHVTLIFRDLDAAESYDFVIGVSGYGVMNPDGSARDSGGDFVPDYSLLIDWTGLPQPDKDDKKHDPYPPYDYWPDPQDDQRKPEGGSHDPNAMVGPSGAGVAGYIPAGLVMPYTVFFENSGPDATLPAQEVFVTNPLPSGLDASTFALTEIVFDNHTITVPAANARYFKTTLDLRPEENLLVEIEAGLDANGQVYCNLTSLDPATGALPADPTVGLLPVNDANHSGEGHVSYVIYAKTNLPTGTEIDNQASIVFDTNDPIATNAAVNTIDASTPVSHVLAPGGSPASSDIHLTWSQSDQGSGIASIALYCSDNGGAYQQIWQGLASGTVYHNAQPGHTYRFYTVATDAVGNAQAAPAADDPDATVTIPPTTTFTLSGKNTKKTFFDSDGTSVTITYVGIGSAVVERWDDAANQDRGDIRDITITGSDAKATLTIATVGKGAAALTSVGQITVHGSLKSIVAKTASLTGNLAVDGSLGSLTLDDAVTGNTITIGPRAASDTKTKLAVTLDQVAEASLASLTPIGTLTVTQWLDSDGTADSIQAPTLDKLQVKGDTKRLLRGDFQADLSLLGPAATGKPALGAVTIAGSLRSAIWNVAGAIGTIGVPGDVGGWIDSDAVTVRATGNMGAITVGSVRHADFLAGTNPAAGGDALITRRADVLADVATAKMSIASFTVKPAKGAVGLLVVNSNLSAYSIGAVKLVNAQFNNDQPGLTDAQDDFGLWSQTVKSVQYADATDAKNKLKNWTWKPGTTLPGGLDDMNITPLTV